MSFVGEACLSTFFEALFAKLGSFESLHFAIKKQVYEELRKWEKILKNIQAVLDDAEEKQMKDRHVKIWLAELQDLAYDVDDILDEFATEALGTKLMQERQADRSKVWKIIHTFITIFNPYAFLFNYKMMSKIKAITVRLQDLVTQKSDLHLRKNDVGRPKRMIERPLTTSLVNEALVYGREDDKKAIIDLLLMNDSSDGKVTMIPIVGIGGIGEKGFDWHMDLKETRELITRKCNGLPLAAKTIGGLLCSRVDPDAWKDVLENEIWNSSEEKCGVIPTLRLSYYHLPPHLKQCFSYCSILPKAYEFGDEEIVLLWMAESLLQLQNLVNSQDALDARLFDKSGLDDLEMKWSANLKDDLRKKEAEKKVLSLLQPHKKLKKLTIKYYGGKLPIMLQHLKIWSCSKLAYLSSSGTLSVGLKYLRIDLCQMLESIAHSVHNNTCLEFIVIGRCEKIQYLSNGLDQLNGLQQIQIECSRNLVSISKLPFTNLRVLRLSWCRKFQALPDGMHILTSLRELEISNCPCLLSFPEEAAPIQTMSPAAAVVKTSLITLLLLEESPSFAIMQIGKIHTLSIAYVPFVKVDHKFAYDLEEES
ncbi:NB-ARC domain-containing disease resistance-like protein [Theobroma cacao]|uniref:NB-ARC domain-containing disease resistance-like protein n=1 Tax=Theobroma cacao TaxID=3641 RepID=A0A061FSU2_THECC|nr:NB-ARC domain-containing disease resistance-like protein [Theobroma cacao]